MMTRWELLCSAKQRGWSDTLPSWNLSEQIEAHPEDWLRIGERGMPIDALLPFCHEITHHLIFDTAVGSALAGLETQARAMAAQCNRVGVVDPRTELALFDFQLRFRTISDLLKPLDEGLALFAELDGTCGLAERPSVRMQWTARLFVDSAGELYEPSAADVDPIIHKFVTTRREFYRKEELLSQPLSCVRNGQVEGDLAGYLSVKNLFTQTFRQDQSFDTDLFISHWIDHFFEDAHLVELLSSPPCETLDDAVAHSDRMIGGIAFRLAECLSSYKPEAAEGHTPPKTSAERKALSHERELMCIARLAADLEQQGDCVEVYIEGELWGAFPARGQPQWRKGPATIEYFISPREKYEAYTVTISSDVVAAIVLAPESGPVIARRLATILPYRDAVQKRAGEESAALASMEKQMAYSSVLADLRDENLERIDKLFTGMVVLRAPNDRKDSCRASMKNNGFLGIFNNDRDLLRRYAALSSFTAIVPSRRFVDHLARKDGIDVDKTLVDLRACSERTGMMLFEAIDDVIFTYA
jgi:hypothetical protein